jgi:hypothetical protein
MLESFGAVGIRDPDLLHRPIKVDDLMGRQTPHSRHGTVEARFIYGNVYKPLPATAMEENGVGMHLGHGQTESCEFLMHLVQHIGKTIGNKRLRRYFIQGPLQPFQIKAESPLLGTPDKTKSGGVVR